MSMLPAPNLLSELITGHDATFVMTRICNDRTRAWELLASLTAAPDAELMTRLAGGGLPAALLEATAWLDDQWHPDGLSEVRGFGRRAEREGAEAVLALLRGHHESAGREARTLAAACRGLAEQCRAELAAWEDERAEEAKRLRVEQMPALAPEAPVRGAAAAVAALGIPFSSAVATLVGEYLRLETGR